MCFHLFFFHFRNLNHLRIATASVFQLIIRFDVNYSFNPKIKNLDSRCHYKFAQYFTNFHPCTVKTETPMIIKRINHLKLIFCTIFFLSQINFPSCSAEMKKLSSSAVEKSSLKREGRSVFQGTRNRQSETCW